MSLDLVDQYGFPIRSYKYQRNAENSGVDRPWIPVKLDEIHKLIPPTDRKTLVGVSRFLCENWGPARNIVRGISINTVGTAWKPSLSGNEAAETAIRDQFLPIAGVGGEDWTKMLYLLTLMVVRDGECFYLLTERASGFPAIQLIPSHRVGQRLGTGNETKVAKGQYAGRTIRDGVIYGRYGNPIAYRLLGETEKDDQDVSAVSMKHVYDADYPEAARGYPALSHGLADGRDALQSHEWERLNMLARSSMTFIEQNESGIPDNDPRNHFLSGGTTPAASTQGSQTGTLFGGQFKTVRAGSGYKLESVKHDTPGETWESFNDRIIRKVCAGVPWPYSFVWDGGKRGSGTGERRDIMLARQTVADMQDLIERHARVMIGYAYAKMAKRGMVETIDNWWKWTFSKPPKITIDDGRVSKANLDLWRAGILSDSDLLDDLGRDHDEHYQSRFEKAADKEIMFAEVQARKAVTLDPRIKGMMTPNEPFPTYEDPQDNADDDSKDQDDEPEQDDDK
jgi:hypothetical protein